MILHPIQIFKGYLSYIQTHSTSSLIRILKRRILCVMDLEKVKRKRNRVSKLPPKVRQVRHAEMTSDQRCNLILDILSKYPGIKSTFPLTVACHMTRQRAQFIAVEHGLSDVTVIQHWKYFLGKRREGCELKDIFKNNKIGNTSKSNKLLENPEEKKRAILDVIAASEYKISYRAMAVELQERGIDINHGILRDWCEKLGISRY